MSRVTQQGPRCLRAQAPEAHRGRADWVWTWEWDWEADTPSLQREQAVAGEDWGPLAICSTDYLLSVPPFSPGLRGSPRLLRGVSRRLSAGLWRKRSSCLEKIFTSLVLRFLIRFHCNSKTRQQSRPPCLGNGMQVIPGKEESSRAEGHSSLSCF